MYGCLSYFSTHLPTDEEIDNCRWVTFTSDAEWEPYSEVFGDAERAMVSHTLHPDPCHPHYDHNGDELDGRQINALNSVSVYPCLDPSLCTFDLSLHRSIAATSSKEHRSNVPIDTLARRWGTSINNAADTLKKTTQWTSLPRRTPDSALPDTAEATGEPIPSYKNVYRYILQRQDVS
jgi:hypothetical protein